MINIFAGTAANVVESSAWLLKADRESGSTYTRSLSDDSGLGGSVYVPPGGVWERSSEHATAMPASHGVNMEEGNYVVDIVLPSVFIALLFIGNAIIVYVIFQYRKRKQPSFGRGNGDGLGGEEMALRNPIEDYRQV